MLHVLTHVYIHVFVLEYLSILILKKNYQIIGWQTLYHVFVVNQQVQLPTRVSTGTARPGLTLRAEGLYFLRVGWSKKLEMSHDMPWGT
jgi:hypothetical protein